MATLLKNYFVFFPQKTKQTKKTHWEKCYIVRTYSHGVLPHLDHTPYQDKGQERSPLCGGETHISFTAIDGGTPGITYCHNCNDIRTGSTGKISLMAVPAKKWQSQMLTALVSNTRKDKGLIWTAVNSSIFSLLLHLLPKVLLTPLRGCPNLFIYSSPLHVLMMASVHLD